MVAVLIGILPPPILLFCRLQSVPTTHMVRKALCYVRNAASQRCEGHALASL